MFAKQTDSTTTTTARLSRWALNNAWKLSGLTAIITFIGIFTAVALNLILRPIPSYFFPLFSDVFKYQPEGTILYLSIIATSLLFFLTTSASIRHCLFVISSTAPNTSEEEEYNCQQKQHLHQFYKNINDDEEDISEIVPVSPLPRRRGGPGPGSGTSSGSSSRLVSTRALILFVLISIISFSTIQFPGLYQPIFKHLTAINLKSLFVNVLFYSIVLTWVLAKGFLIWYFLKLQNIPDYDIEQQSRTIYTDSSSPPPRSPYSVQQQHEESSPSPLPEQNTNGLSISDRIKAFASWMIAILRPICLTGQAVCLIKIFGLWLALDTFSISNIRLVKIALLATLAFVEYTTVFFFVFFMTILANDMRSKAPPSHE